MMINRRQAIGGMAATGAAAAAPAMARTSATPWPKGFLWGVATAGHQIEGNSTASDYWLLEHLAATDFAEPSGDACDSWSRWREDLALVKALGLNAYRFSIEWARIEPEEGQFSAAALDHYRTICIACREAGIVPIVTFHHFVSPRWLAAKGGWEAAETPERFARYAERTATALGPLIGMACTLNEPNAQVNSFVLRGGRPGAKEAAMLAEARRQTGSDHFNSWFMGDAFKVRDTCIAAHKLGGDAIRAAIPGIKVGMTLALQDWRVGAAGQALYKRLFAEARTPFYEATAQDEFIGVQPYLRYFTGPDGFLPAPAGAYLNRYGAEASPDVIASVIAEVRANTPAPIMITENGIDAVDDLLRAKHLTMTVEQLRSSLDPAKPILGYIHWSLIDNWEWRTGYAAKFGLYAVDRQTFARTPKRSAAIYRDLVRTALRR